MRITIKNLSYTYHPKSPFERKVLFDINVDIEANQVGGDYWSDWFRKIHLGATFERSITSYQLVQSRLEIH